MNARRLRRIAVRATVAVTAVGSTLGLLGTAPAQADIDQCQQVTTVQACVHTFNLPGYTHDAAVDVYAPAPLDGNTQVIVECHEDSGANSSYVFLAVDGAAELVPVGGLPFYNCPNLP